MKFAYKTLILCFFMSISSFGQNINLDIWNNDSLPAEERASAGINYAWSNGKTDTDKGLEIVAELLSDKYLDKISEDQSLLARFLQIRLTAYKTDTDHIPTLQGEYNKAVKENNIKKKAFWSYYIGYESQLVDDYHTSVEYFILSIPFYEAIKDTNMVAKIHRNLSFIHGTTGNTDKAIEAGLEGIRLFESISKKTEVINLKARLCSMYLEIGDTNQAEVSIHEAEDLAEELGNPVWINFCRSPKSDLLQAMGKYEEANALLLESLEYNLQQPDKRMISYNYAIVSQSYLKLNNPSKAVQMAEQGLQIALDNELIKEKLDNLEIIHSAYYQNHQYKKAYEYFEQYLELQNELKGAEDIADIERQLADYEANKLALADSLNQAKLNFEKDLSHQKELSDQKRQKYITGAIVIILLIGGGALFLVFKRTKKHNAELAAQKEIVETQKNEIVDSIKYAKRIQSAILPPDKVVKANLENSFILYKPKDIVAGDFYWMQTVESKTIFAAADCTGHGVPGALVSVVCHNALNRSVKEFNLSNPADILDKTRELIVTEFQKSDEEVKDGMDIAICVLNDLNLEYAGAHNPLWIIRNGDFENVKDASLITRNDQWQLFEIKADKQPVGISHQSNSFTSHTIKLKENDRIYIFSDGYSDQFGGNQGKKFKTKAFKELLLSIQQLDMDEQKKKIDETFEEWKGGIEQLDDVCVIGVRI
ncbi:MAG: SpoIIE family protein phosphatase [Crocinitomicaceae bacterium]|nr:SpoIIE family protein phosphatase [Crocinitomicaceae bacterium]